MWQFCCFLGISGSCALSDNVNPDIAGLGEGKGGFLFIAFKCLVNKRVRNAVLGCNLQNDRMISVRFQGKPFNITVIQVNTMTNNTEEAEDEQFYEDLQDLLQLTPKKYVLLI